MENRRKIHQDRVNKKERTGKETYEIGEKCLIQDVISKGLRSNLEFS